MSIITTPDEDIVNCNPSFAGFRAKWNRLMLGVLADLERGVLCHAGTGRASDCLHLGKFAVTVRRGRMSFEIALCRDHRDQLAELHLPPGWVADLDSVRLLGRRERLDGPAGASR